MLRTLFFIGIGSFCGGVFRFLLTRFIHNATHSLPMGTFVVNILGCLLIGLLYGIFERGNLLNNELRLFLTVGLCGGFTTFSTFLNENFMLFREGQFLYFILYTTLSIIVGLFAVYLGHLIIKIF